MHLPDSSQKFTAVFQESCLYFKQTYCTITQSASDLISQSIKYIFSVSSGNNTQLTGKEALNTFFDSSASTKLTIQILISHLYTDCIVKVQLELHFVSFSMMSFSDSSKSKGH
ncbi:BAM_G0014870.mRNA.1.CDS.1 [Saccharomyces cerevisiae]|nr:BAM_G0014870.mRNA.1.CDS.1 [Saccharomyces cerevisiae]CAI7098920.1 BAM_G0014870.mRNA.1.CDS.1 [Saccharomyces cerevisiae]